MARTGRKTTGGSEWDKPSRKQQEAIDELKSSIEASLGMSHGQPKKKRMVINHKRKRPSKKKPRRWFMRLRW